MAISGYSGSFGSVRRALPGQQQAVQSPMDSVNEFKNQALGGLATGSGAAAGPTAGPAAAQSPTQALLGMRSTKPSAVQMSAQRRTDAVKGTNERLLANAKTQRARIDSERQAAQSVQQSGGRRPLDYINGQGGGQRATTGPTVNRIQALLPHFPGLRISEIGGNREYDQSNGVKRWSGSLHYDTKNPAVDIAGPPAQLDKLYAEMVRQGKWRQILYRTPGHYDHIHVG